MKKPKTWFVILNSKGEVDCIENECYEGKWRWIPRIFPTLKSARYSLSKYCELRRGKLYYECGSIARISINIEEQFND